VLGYVRQRAIAYYIGNGWAADALSVAQRIPNAIRNLLAEGTLSASFIPVYAALNERSDKQAARALAGAILGLLLLATGVLAVIGIAFAPALTTVFGAGLTGESRALAVSLRKTRMGGHEGRAGSETAVDFLGRPPPLVDVEEMKREQACGGIERPFGRIVDIALLQLHPRIERPQRLLRQL